METPDKSSKISQARNVREISYHRLRSLLIVRGTNLKRWAQQNNLPIGTVYHAARGTRAGIQSVLIRNRLLSYVRH